MSSEQMVVNRSSKHVLQYLILSTLCSGELKINKSNENGKSSFQHTCTPSSSCHKQIQNLKVLWKQGTHERKGNYRTPLNCVSLCVVRSKVKLMNSLVISNSSVCLWVMDLDSSCRKNTLLRWHATKGYWESDTRTMLFVRMFAKRAKQPLENKMDFWPQKWKPRWFGHILAKKILQSTVKEKRRWVS